MLVAKSELQRGNPEPVLSPGPVWIGDCNPEQEAGGSSC